MAVSKDKKKEALSIFDPFIAFGKFLGLDQYRSDLKDIALLPELVTKHWNLHMNLYDLEMKLSEQKEEQKMFEGNIEKLLQLPDNLSDEEFDYSVKHIFDEL